MLLVYRVSNWEEAAALHNQAMYRGSTSLFTQASNPIIHELQDRLRTGALNINRSTIGASVRLPSSGLGRSSNGHASGADLLRFVTYPRSQIVEDRPLLPEQTMLPGLGWELAHEPPTDASVSTDATDEEDIAPAADGDVSDSLELTVE
jgi:delta 1-pyrroline-5-carboxylate dehydrogenase